MKCSDKTDTHVKLEPERTVETTMLAGEAGVPFQPPLTGACGAAFSQIGWA